MDEHPYAGVDLPTSADAFKFCQYLMICSHTETVLYVPPLSFGCGTIIFQSGRMLLYVIQSVNSYDVIETSTVSFTNKEDVLKFKLTLFRSIYIKGKSL